MPHVRAIVFDLDGTLVDSREDIAAATNHALREHGLGTLDTTEVASYVGDGARVLLARAARKNLHDATLDALLATFLDHYRAHPIDHTRLMPGAREALDAVSFLPLAVCTNKPRLTTVAVLRGLGLCQRFAVVVSAGDLPQQKPEPGPLLFIAERLAVAPSELMMVGDGPQDIECGRAVGARTVGVLGGIAERERLLAAQPETVIPSLAELPELLRGYATSA